MGIALVALFVALSGTAVALPGKNRVDKNDPQRGSIGTRAIANNSVRSGDIRTGNVRSSDVLNNSLLSEDVKDDALTGSDITESSLGQVPSANTANNSNTANNANTVGNQSPAKLKSTAAFAQSGTVTALPAAFTTVVSTTITTQSGGLVQANGSVELQGANGDAEGRCRMLIDGVSSVQLEGASDDVSPPDPFVISVNFARTLAAGAHSVALQCQRETADAVTKDDATLNVTGTPG